MPVGHELEKAVGSRREEKGPAKKALKYDPPRRMRATTRRREESEEGRREHS